MWHAKISRNELLEIFFGGGKLAIANIRESHAIDADNVGSEYKAFWHTVPKSGFMMPAVVITPNDEGNFYATVNSNPQAIVPASAFCRFFTKDEAIAYFNTQTSLPGIYESKDVLPVISALAMAEATLLSEGRVNIRQLSPALCKRTLSYAWAKSIAAGVPEQFLSKVPARWMDCYLIINSQHASSAVHFKEVSQAAVQTLAVASQLHLGVEPTSLPGKLAYALFAGDRHSVESSWRELRRSLPDGSTDIEQLKHFSREERGGLLQNALKVLAGPHRGENASAACAFLATQVAPGSLEHMGLLREGGDLSVLMWYALFAAIQHPSPILYGNGALGQRVWRDVSAIEDVGSRPVADISYAELKALARFGSEGLSRKLGHVGEIEVELIPLVTASFTMPSRKSDARAEMSHQSNLSMYLDQSAREMSPKARLKLLLAHVGEVLAEIPERSYDEFDPGRKKRK